MKNGINKVILAGSLGADAETRNTQSGQTVVNFRMATSESYKDKSGERKESTEWHTIVLWGKLGEAIGQYLVKGKSVIVEGKLQTRSWEKDGVKRYSTEVNASNVILLGGGDSRQGSNKSQGSQQELPDDDDIPF